MKVAGQRWWIVTLLFLAAVLNYVDKNSLALLAPTLQQELGLSDQDYANIQNAFQIAYTVALLASGVIVDKLGARLSLALFVGWWSVANVLTAFARSASSLGAFRLLLGLGEAGNWTASPKTVAEWFPARERGLAIGIYSAGTPLGMTLAPICVISLQQAFGWQSAFVLTGLLGLVWLVPWWLLSRRGETDSPPAVQVAAAPAWTWQQAFARWEVWCLLFGRMLSDPVWFFYQNWYPKYLVSARGLSQAQVKITWVMFLAAGLGSLLGGWFAGRLIRRGGGVERSRLFTMLGCVVVMPLSLLVARVPTMEASLALASLIVFAHLAWLVNISALVVDVVPGASLGKVFGLVAAGSSAGAVVMNGLVANLLKQGSYSQWFVIAAFLHIAAWVCLAPLLQRRKTLA
jgi:ACS family hexuronate transporter-like MFS transporter